MAQLLIGTSGWSYKHWRGLFYPQDLPPGEWFSYYKDHFNTVEINNTFYHLPAEKTFRNWRKQAPEGFIYAVKASRYITHIKRLRDSQLALEKFIRRVRLLGETLGPILYQLPPRWRPDLERLKGFIEALPRDLIHIFEFRDPRWLCQPVYLRLHGSRLLYASRYTQRELEEWARYEEKVG